MFKAMSLDGVNNINLDGRFFAVYESVEAVKAAIDRFSRKGPYLICKETNKRVFDANGIFVRSESVTEAVEVYEGVK